jgi:hypothetical protein
MVVAVVEVVDAHVTVVEGGLFDALHPEHLSVEVVILLGAAHAQGDVVMAPYAVLVSLTARAQPGALPRRLVGHAHTDPCCEQHR